jgi:hypothetical protein
MTDEDEPETPFDTTSIPYEDDFEETIKKLQQCYNQKVQN